MIRYVSWNDFNPLPFVSRCNSYDKSEDRTTPDKGLDREET